MWIGVIITLLIGGFLFYALATAHKHIDDTEIIVESINDAGNELKSKDLTKKEHDAPLKENKTLPNIFNIFNSTINKSKTLEQQKFIVSYTENKQHEEPTNKDVIGLYLFEDIWNSILYTFGMLVAVSLPKVPTGWAIRILTGWWWMYCLLVAVAYKASMTAILANPDTRFLH